MAREAKKAKKANRKPRTKEGWLAKATARKGSVLPEPGVFTWDDPERIARSLAKSAEESPTRRGTPYRAAMSLLCFHLNRAGRTLPAGRRRVLERAKKALRASFGR